MQLLEVIQGGMHVRGCMIFIMEENEVWDIQKGENYDIWSGKKCSLIIEYSKNKCIVLIDYKGYNVIMPMGMWGFEEEVMERNIQYEIAGDKGDFKSIRYIINIDDLKLFGELINLFLQEHDLDKVLNDAFKI